MTEKEYSLPESGGSGRSLADLSIKRPTFITCVIVLMLAVGYVCMQKLGIDLFPDVTFPVVFVSTPYLGAGPEEIETLVTKPLEEELSSLSGLKRITSISQEGISAVIAEFTLETNIKFAEQEVRDRVGSVKRKLPKDIREPSIRRMDPADQPILILGMNADLPPAELFDVANEVIRPKLEQVGQVGLVEVLGGRKREIQVNLDRNKLKAREISASLVANRLAISGENIPVGKIDQGEREVVFRTLGQFKNLGDIGSTIINFYGNDVPVTLKDLGTVTDGLSDEISRTYINGKKSLFIFAFRQAGANTIAVVDALRAKVDQLNTDLKNQPGNPQLNVVRDGGSWIRANVQDVKESIFMGVVLAVLVVFLFLGNGRSTIITGLALPNSLIGAFILMALAGFTVNIMTLLALSLSVGLLIDDAIVVRENIFRHIEMGKKPVLAALIGTAEVRMAVIATTMTVIAVFGPVGFLKGVTGQFFKQFGLTICFAMAISLFDALTIAPMLSAYFAGVSHKREKTGLWDMTFGRVLKAFGHFQDFLENRYEKLIYWILKRPFLVLGMSLMIFLGSSYLVKFVPKTFLPPQDAGEFAVGLDLPPGKNLAAMTEVALKVDTVVRSVPEVETTALTIGGRDGSLNVSDTYVHLIPSKKRKLNTSQVKDIIREKLKEYAYANPKVRDYDAVSSGQRPFTLNILGSDQNDLEKISMAVFEKLKSHPGLKDIDTNFRTGKPEVQIVPDKRKLETLGISSLLLGQELRTQVEGDTPVVFRENGREYDIRVRLQEDQRDLRTQFHEAYVPNINQNLIRLADLAKPVSAEGPAKITRQDRSRYIQINADITPGAGLGNIMTDVTQIFDKEIKMPPGMRYAFVGQAENFKELGESVAMAMGFGILFIFLVLASLYESFVTPMTIMLALPLAICGSFMALFVTGQSLNIFSMIGTLMLLGVATKNSILLVDYANQLIAKGVDRSQAIAQAGKVRLRPILMTTMALIAGTSPVALGLNEASRQRTSMGIAIIGGLISSTLLTLVVVPAAFSYIDRFRVWSKATLFRITAAKG